MKHYKWEIIFLLWGGNNLSQTVIDFPLYVLYSSESFAYLSFFSSYFGHPTFSMKWSICLSNNFILLCILKLYIFTMLTFIYSCYS